MNAEIEQLAGRIARQFDPERIILFGSHADGRADAESDIDLLVVMDHPGRPVEQTLAIRRFLDYRKPLDVLVRTPAELRRRLDLGDRFLQQVIEEGIVMYERPRP
jgi:predicted nucleotidyltransferase